MRVEHAGRVVSREQHVGAAALGDAGDGDLTDRSERQRHGALLSAGAEVRQHAAVRAEGGVETTLWQQTHGQRLDARPFERVARAVPRGDDAVGCIDGHRAQ